MINYTYEKCLTMLPSELKKAAEDIRDRGHAGEFIGEDERRSLYNLVVEYRKKANA